MHVRDQFGVAGEPLDILEQQAGSTLTDVYPGYGTDLLVPIHLRLNSMQLPSLFEHLQRGLMDLLFRPLGENPQQAAGHTGTYRSTGRWCCHPRFSIRLSSRHELIRPLAAPKIRDDVSNNVCVAVS